LMMRFRRKLLFGTGVPANVALPLLSSTMLLLAEDACLRLVAWIVEMVASYAAEMSVARFCLRP
jgi:hypothetical protein